MKSTSSKTPRALTVDETLQLVQLLCENEHAIELDLPDVVDWTLATGSRIGEALATRMDQTAAAVRS